MGDDYALPKIDHVLKGYSTDDLLKEVFSRYEVVTFCALRYDEIKDRDCPWIIEQGNCFTLMGLYEVMKRRLTYSFDEQEDDEG